MHSGFIRLRHPLFTLCGQIYRCHVVWNNSKRAIAIPCFLLIGGSGNLSSNTLLRLFKLIPKPSLWICLHCCLERGLSLSTATDNFPVHHRRFESTRYYSHGCVFPPCCLSLWYISRLMKEFLAGRIWWIARKARSILGPRLSSKYNTMIAIMYVVPFEIHDAANLTSIPTEWNRALSTRYMSFWTWFLRTCVFNSWNTPISTNSIFTKLILDAGLAQVVVYPLIWFHYLILKIIYYFRELSQRLL